MDISLELQIGKPINFNNICKIYQKTFDDIYEYGFKDYEQLITPYALTKECLNIEDENVSNFDLLFIKLKDEEGKEVNVFELFIKSLSFFCNENNVMINQDTLDIVLKNGIINRDNFDEFAEVILKINGTQRFKKPIPPKNKDSKDLWEKLRKGRKRQQEKNKKNNQLSTIIKYIKFGTETYISKEEILKMTMWEIYDTYGTIMNKENYDRNFEIMLVAGNEKNELDLTHWSLKNNE